VIRNGAMLYFEEEERARAECDQLNARLREPHVHYSVRLAQPSHSETSSLATSQGPPNGDGFTRSLVACPAHGQLAIKKT